MAVTGAIPQGRSLGRCWGLDGGRDGAAGRGAVIEAQDARLLPPCGLRLLPLLLMAASLLEFLL